MQTCQTLNLYKWKYTVFFCLPIFWNILLVSSCHIFAYDYRSFIFMTCRQFRYLNNFLKEEYSQNKERAETNKKDSKMNVNHFT